MKKNIVIVCLLLLCSTPIFAKQQGKPEYTKEYKELLSLLKRDMYKFTPSVRTSYLKFRKSQALKELRKHKIRIPRRLLSYIDETPVVASTIYGIRYGSPAKALVVLRSLQLDVGMKDLKKYFQIVLATVMLHANKVNLKNPEVLDFVSLKYRGLLKVKIPKSGLVRVDTHPKGRALDKSDHIINFMEEKNILKNGKVTIVKRKEFIKACDIVASKKLQAEFNTYMASRVKGFKPLDCGDKELHWNYGGVSWRLPHKKEHTRAFNMFMKAYTSKGRLPKKRDSNPNAAEWLAYHINNAKKRGEQLPDAWPYAMYLVNNPIPLREAEWAWAEKARGLNPTRYIEYVGKVAQDLPKLRLRRLMQFDFSYNSLPMLRKDGGVCGTHTSTVTRAGAALGKPVLSCSSPGHSFPAMLLKEKEGYIAPNASSSVRWYFGKGKPEGTGADRNKISSLAAAMNWGLMGYVDSQLGWTMFTQLPEDIRKAHGFSLLTSTLARNPYNISLLREARTHAKTCAQLITFWNDYEKIINSKKIWKLPKAGIEKRETWKYITKSLDKLPIPNSKITRNKIYAALRKDKRLTNLVIRYGIKIQGAETVLMNIRIDLGKHFGMYFRTQKNNMASRVRFAIEIIENEELKKRWLKSQMRLFGNRGFYITKVKKEYQVKMDETTLLFSEFTAMPIDKKKSMKALLDQTSKGLEAHLKVRRYTNTCKIMAAKLEAVISAAKKKGVDLKPWADTWFKMMDGKQRYARHAWTAKDAASVVIDALVKESAKK